VAALAGLVLLLLVIRLGVWLVVLPERRKVAARIRAWEMAGYQEGLYGIQCDFVTPSTSYKIPLPSYSYNAVHPDPHKITYCYGYWPQLEAKAVALSLNSKYRLVTLSRKEGDRLLKWSWEAGAPVGAHPDLRSGDIEVARRRRLVRVGAALRRWRTDPRTGAPLDRDE
jgi:hypothetical protein